MWTMIERGGGYATLTKSRAFVEVLEISDAEAKEISGKAEELQEPFRDDIAGLNKKM